MIIRIDKGFMGELQKKGYDLDYRNLAEIYQAFRHKQGQRAEMVTCNEGEEEASERHNQAPF
jgi:hypothetical protein